MAIFMEPVVLFLNKNFKLNRTFSSFIVILFLIGIIFLTIFLIFSIAIGQAKELLYFSTQNNDKLAIFIIKIQDFFIDLFFLMPIELKNDFANAYNNFIPAITNFFINGFKNFSFGFFKALPEILIYFLLGILSSFFILKDRKKIDKILIKNTPKIISYHYKIVKIGLSQVIGGYFRAQFMLMSLSFAISFFGITLLQYRYAILMALIIAIIDALPILGGGAILWPWAIFSFVTGEKNMCFGLMIIYVIIFITRQILEPKIFGEQIGLNPLVTLMSIYIGIKIFGIWGLMLGPIISVIIKSIWISEEKMST